MGNQRRGRRIRFMWVLALTLILEVSATQASPSAELSVDFCEKTGDICKFALDVESVPRILTLDVSIEYDPSVFSVSDEDETQAGIQVGVGGFLEPDFVISNRVEDNVIELAISLLNPSEPASGDGNVLNFQATLLKDLPSEVRITKAQKTELDRRYEEFRADPNNTIPAEDVFTEVTRELCAE